MAISASLLPPAVNTGLYWAMAMLSSSFGDSVHNNGTETLDHIQVGALLTATVISATIVCRTSSSSTPSTGTSPWSCSGAA